jgi:hypothetical protein
MSKIFYLSVFCLLATHFMAFNGSYVVAYGGVRLIKQASQSKGNVQTLKTQILAFVERNNGLQESYNGYSEVAHDYHLLVLEAQKVDKDLVDPLQFKSDYYDRKANLVSDFLVKGLPNAVLQWDKGALAKLATDINGVRAFENLSNIMDIANGNTSEKTPAQRILLDLTKNAQGQDDYTRVQQLYFDLTDVAAHTVNSRANLLPQVDDWEKQFKKFFKKNPLKQTKTIQKY